MKLLICTQVVDQNHPILGFFHRWIEEFALHFERIDVICLEEGEHTLPPHVHVHSLGKEAGKGRLTYLYRFYKYCWRYYVRQDVRYVFFHMGAVYNLLAAPFFWFRKVKGAEFYWWKAHGTINWVGRLALRFVDRVYTSTESGFPIASKKRHVIGQAIDTALFVPGIQTTKKIIFVGRIMPVKKVEEFLKTMQLLRQQGIEAPFQIIGPFADEVYKEQLQQVFTSLQFKENFNEVFVGPKPQSELVAVYQSAYCFLNTSLTHSMDKTVLEAALSGCVPVTANRAFEELLSPYDLYLPEATPEQYATRIAELLQTPPTFMTQLRADIVAAHSLATFPNRIFN